jgi:hypothetical protein
LWSLPPVHFMSGLWLPVVDFDAPFLPTLPAKSVTTGDSILSMDQSSERSGAETGHEDLASDLPFLLGKGLAPIPPKLVARLHGCCSCVASFLEGVVCNTVSPYKKIGHN